MAQPQISRNPTEAATADGVSSTVCGNTMVVYGGWDADRIWQLDLPAAVWTEIMCGGDIPYPRLHHACCFFKGALSMTGGERLQPAGPQEKPAYTLGYYELDLDSYEWMAVECFGILPRARSHHTVEAVDDCLYVLGGKPLTERTLSAAALSEEKRNGFFDLFVLHVQSRTWRRVEMYDPQSPMVWGSTCSQFRNSFLLFFGGFDVSSHTSSFVPSGMPGEGAPIAELSNVIHILKLDNMTWMRYTPQRGENAPVPRVGHCEYVNGAECIIYGGMTLDFAGRSLNVNDCWIWSIESGRWSRLEFCVPSWPSKRLISGMHGSQFVVCPSLRDCFFLNLATKGSGWQRVTTTTSRPIIKEGLLGTGATTTAGNEQSSTEPGTAASNIASTQIAPGVSQPGEASHPGAPTQYDVDVSGLQAEVEALKAQLAASEIKRKQMKENMNKSDHAGKAKTAEDDGLPKPASMVHWADVVPIKTHPIHVSELPQNQVQSSQQEGYVEEDRPAWKNPGDPNTPSQSPVPPNGERSTSRDYQIPTVSAAASSSRPPPTGVRSTSLDSMNSVEYFQHLRKQRGEIADNRRKKISELQNRLQFLEKNSLDRSQKVETIRAIREETKRLESAVDHQGKSTVQRVAEQRSPLLTAKVNQELVDAVHPRTDIDDAAPLLYQASSRHNRTKGTSQHETLFTNQRREIPSSRKQSPPREAGLEPAPHPISPTHREASSRAASPVNMYWEQLDRVMHQPPAIRGEIRGNF